MLGELDPYTIYYPESKIEEYSFQTTGVYGGVGAVITERDKHLIISDIYKDSPADIHNLKIGDEITAIDGHEINLENFETIKETLKGESGSSVALKS